MIGMSLNIHPVATHHLPAFVTAPGETDILFNVVMLFLLVVFVAMMLLYFRLHALPEHIAHRGEKIQYQIVAVLALISLFTHNHIFWIIGLLLALISMPDFTTPLMSMSESLAKMANGKPITPNLEPVPSSGRRISRPHKAAEE
jgi:ABC-type Na+ efflux pump permease subunit